MPGKHRGERQDVAAVRVVAGGVVREELVDLPERSGLDPAGNAGEMEAEDVDVGERADRVDPERRQLVGRHGCGCGGADQ